VRCRRLFGPAVRRPSGSVEQPVGTLYGPDRVFNLQVNGQLEDAAGFRQLIVAYRNGAPVRLADIADVTDGVQDDKNAAWFGEQRSIVLAIQKQPGTNTLAVVDRIRGMLPQFRAILPAGVEMTVQFDRSLGIRQSVEEVEFSLVLALCLVVLVIFLFLRTLRATLIPSLALPMAIVGTFAIRRITCARRTSGSSTFEASGYSVPSAATTLTNIPIGCAS